MRGVAVLLVTVSHSHVPVLKFGGTVGLTMFFVLSGYLITTILWKEKEHSGSIRLRAFYFRRALRLLPALIVALGVGSVLWIAFDHDALDTAKAAALCLFYSGNLSVWLGVDLSPFEHYWSLAMEEQYYLLWPFVLLAMRRTRATTLISLTLLAAAISLALRFTGPINTVAGYRHSYYLPQTNVWSLLLGSALAIWLAGRAVRFPSLPAWTGTVAAIGLLGVSSVLGLRTGLQEKAEPATYMLRLIAAPLAASCALVLVFLAVTSEPAVAWLQHRWLVFFGRISYGLYLWHSLLASVVTSQLGSLGIRGLASGLISSGIATAAAVLSMRMIEAPFLRRKQRFELALTAP
jgi:peptidoglycan/LPS O-acetylase OafA/YrhL